jgi:hypothetical protein
MENKEIDDSTREIRNDYATKMLILFYPYRQIHDFPELNNKWKFFKEAYEIGSLLKILKMKTILQIAATPMVTVPMKMLTLFLRKLKSLMRNY